jgi:hypothetical protein
MVRSDMDWFRPIWVLCERTERGLFAEPANVLTSLALLAVAFAAIAASRADGRRDMGAALLGGLLILSGIGSLLFHTLAVRWALYVDLFPIQLFVGAYFFISLRRFFGLSTLAAILATACFVLAARWYVDWVPWSFMRGYGRLLPALGVLFAIALLVRLRAVEPYGLPGVSSAAAREVGGLLIAASLAMAAAIVCGASDRVVCAYSSVGSHPLWHLLVATALGLMLKAALVAGPARREAPEPVAAEAR